MHNLKKVMFTLFVISAAFSLFILTAQAGLAEESSSSSKVTFHVA